MNFYFHRVFQVQLRWNQWGQVQDRMCQELAWIQLESEEEMRSREEQNPFDRLSLGYSLDSGFS